MSAKSAKPPAMSYVTNGLPPFTQEDVKNAMTSDSNVNYLVQLVIQRVDPLRNGVSADGVTSAKVQATGKLSSWAALGKFDTRTSRGKSYPIYAPTLVSMVDHYNKEFVNIFGDTLFPQKALTAVTSVLNPNGLYAQQDRIVAVSGKPIPSYQRCAFKRLTDRHKETSVDETENMFYKMDANPRISNDERKKRERGQTVLQPSAERDTLQYRMIPKY